MYEFHGRATTELAMQLFREGKLHECIACVDKVIAANPDDALAYSILGAAYAQFGDRGMAIAAFERSLAIEPSARSHFNLGAAYERSGRIQEALEQFRLAVQMDPSYRPAADALNRLSKAPPAEDVPASAAQAEHVPHLLTGESEPPSEVPAPSAKAPPPTPPQEGAATLQGAPPPNLLTSQSRPEPTIVADPGFTPPVEPGPQPVGIPTFTPPHTTQGPDLRALEMRARESEEKAHRAQMEMTKAGLIYGIILGPLGLMGIAFIFQVIGLVVLSFSTALIGGVILGALVGLWTGFTGGDESDGAKAGALLGALAQGVPALLHVSEIGWGWFVFSTILGVIIGGGAGFFIGMMVERSIGQ